jgi:hypothetical protein
MVQVSNIDPDATHYSHTLLDILSSFKEMKRRKFSWKTWTEEIPGET